MCFLNTSYKYWYMTLVFPVKNFYTAVLSVRKNYTYAPDGSQLKPVLKVRDDCMMATQIIFSSLKRSISPLLHQYNSIVFAHTHVALKIRIVRKIGFGLFSYKFWNAQNVVSKKITTSSDKITFFFYIIRVFLQPPKTYD